jgi:hypothetical protein
LRASGLRGRRRHAILAGMLNLVSLLFGLVTLVFGLVAFIPLLGWMNWLVIPIGIVGAAIGAMSSSNTGRNLNLVLIVIFALRLSLGGGII